MELNQKVYKGTDMIYFVKIYPNETSPSWTKAMMADKVVSLWTLCKWTPLWTRTIITPCELKSPSM